MEVKGEAMTASQPYFSKTYPQRGGRTWEAKFVVFGSPTRTRTTDILINSQTLYQLSYRGIGRHRKVRAGILVQGRSEVKLKPRVLYDPSRSQVFPSNRRMTSECSPVPQMQIRAHKRGPHR